MVLEGGIFGDGFRRFLEMKNPLTIGLGANNQWGDLGKCMESLLPDIQNFTLSNIAPCSRPYP